MKTTELGSTRLLISAVLLAVLAGCYEHRYVVGAGAPTGRIVYEEWRHHWLGGLISPDQTLRVREVCPSGNATIHQEMTFLNGLVASLTSGIYVPMTVKVRCADGRGSDLDLSASQIELIVLDEAFAERVETVLPEWADAVRAAQDRDRQDR